MLCRAPICARDPFATDGLENLQGVMKLRVHSRLRVLLPASALGYSWLPPRLAADGIAPLVGFPLPELF